MKNLFRVMSAGNVINAVDGSCAPALVGSFGSKFLALKAMRSYNRKLRPGERPVWITHGPDHWRAKENNRVPKRGAEPVWIQDDSGPVLEFVKPSIYWLGENHV